MKRVLALFLSLALALPLPALGAEGAPVRTYEQTVAELGLQNPTQYVIETTLETDLCTVFLYRRIGTPHISYNQLKIVYKAGAPQGEGTAVDVTLSEDTDLPGTTTSPDAIELSEDGKSVLYTHFFPDYGMDHYTVDLATGIATVVRVPPTQEQLIDWFVSQSIAVETRLEGSGQTAVLMRSKIRDSEYFLYLFAQEPEKTDPEAWFRRLLLPSTAPVGSLEYPTDRPPDSMTLSGDGSKLTYVYHFEDTLFNADGDLLHDSGTYTYTVELATGELTVTHEKDAPGPGAEGSPFTDVSPDDWFAPYVDICVEEGLMVGTGEGMFSPYGTLSDHESTVLALRLHDLGRGGDGSFEKAPWDWGYAFLTLPDGTVREGYLADGTSWDWTRLGRADSGHFGFQLDTEEEKAWGRSMDYQSATLTLSGKEYAGELHLNGPGFLYFNLSGDWDDDEEYREGYYAIQDALDVPTPNAWWRDAWYYAEQNGLEDLLHRGSIRQTFAFRMAAITDLPAVNEVPGLPDTGDPDVLELYRAGVLTGSDEYGTFNGHLTLTRAEAAAICARILRPELRVRFSPKPLETYEPYTLTYLREDGERPGVRYLPKQSMDLLVPDPHSLLRLDGVELPVPEGYEVRSIGEGLAGVAHTEEDAFGLIDREGQFRPCTRQEVYENPLLSVRHYDTEGLINGYQQRGYAFYNEKGEQVTPAFAWASAVNPEGAGFVGMDGKIYRLQFEH